MLYRVMTSCPAVKDGLLFAFVDLGPDDADEVSHAKVAADAEARFALTYGVPLEGVWDIKSALQLEADGAGPASLPAYKWFEYGQQGGKPTYIETEEAVYLLDDRTTADMLSHALNAATSPHLTAMGPEEEDEELEPAIEGPQHAALCVLQGMRVRVRGHSRKSARAPGRVIDRLRARLELARLKNLARNLVVVPSEPPVGYGLRFSIQLVGWAFDVDAAIHQAQAKLDLMQMLGAEA